MNALSAKADGTTYPLGRFLAFAYPEYYPAGINLVGSFNDLESACALAKEKAEGENAEVLDQGTGQLWVWDGLSRTWKEYRHELG